MLKRVFMAADPGRARLRFAARAVLGIGLAVVVCGLAGHSLAGAVTGGLAALLALFTVTDATVRGQALTTALLPAVGLPVLAAAAELHDHPVARDLVLLAVVGAGVYARRWGPRGHSLGVFAFMTFFVAQFLHATTDQLPELYAAVLLSALTAAAVRFGLWCYERRLPPTPVPAPPAGTGLARATTRQAVQAMAGAGFALVVGQLISGQRWYWAVGATWWIFVNTTSRGETLVRGFRRVLGTVIGIGLGLLVAVPLHGEPAPTAVLLAVCVFGVFYTAAVSYTWMMLWVTLLAELLYGLLGVLNPGLLALRFAETGVGAVGAVLAVLFVLPITTHAVTDAWIQRALRCVHACTAEAAARLAGVPGADPGRPGDRAGATARQGPALGGPAGPPPQPHAGPQAPRPPRPRPPRRLRPGDPGPGHRRGRPRGLARRPPDRRVPTGGGRCGGPHRRQGLPGRGPPPRRGTRAGPSARTGKGARGAGRALAHADRFAAGGSLNPRRHVRDVLVKVTGFGLDRC